MKKMNRKGFTIVELVIVIAVIAILAAVLIPTFSGIVDKANNSSVIQETRAALTVLLVEENGQVDTTAKYYFIHADGNNKTYFEYINGEVTEIKNTAVVGWDNVTDPDAPKVVPDNNDVIWYAKGDTTILASAGVDAKCVYFCNKKELSDLKNIVIYKSVTGGDKTEITADGCAKLADHNTTDTCEVCGFKCAVLKDAVVVEDGKCKECGNAQNAHPVTEPAQGE